MNEEKIINDCRCGVDIKLLYNKAYTNWNMCLIASSWVGVYHRLDLGSLVSFSGNSLELGQEQ